MASQVNGVHYRDTKKKDKTLFTTLTSSRADVIVGSLI